MTSFVEDTFARVVRGAGGSVLADELRAPDLARNADYVFRDFGAIAELKRLEKDLRDEDGLVPQLSALYQKWQREHRRVPPIAGRGWLNIHDLPPDCQWDVVEVYKKPIAKRIKSANDQIKSTRELLGLPEAKGLLILAQDGDYSLDPEMCLFALHHCAKGQRFSGIDDIIYVNVEPAGRAGDDTGYMFFVRAFRDEANAVSDELIKRLEKGWFQALAESGRPQTIVSRGGFDEMLPSLKFRPSLAPNARTSKKP